MKFFSSQGKFNVFLIFLILAILFSLVDKLTSTYEKDIVFSIVIKDVPADKVIYEKSHDSILLRVKGYAFNLAKYYFNNPVLEISVKKLKEIDNSFLWVQKENFKDTELSFNSQVKLLTIFEDSLFFYYDQYISQKKYIKPNVSIDYKSGYDSFEPFSISNDSVTILGPKDILNEIDYIETEILSLSDVNSDINIDLNLLKPAYDDIILDFKSVKYKLEVDQYTEENIIIPVSILGGAEFKYNFYPKELSVKYFISMENYKKTSPIDFRIECIFDQNKTMLVPSLIKKPKFIKNAKLSSNQVQLIILE